MIKKILIVFLGLVLVFNSCRKEEGVVSSDSKPVTHPDPNIEGIKGFYLLNEGPSGKNKATLDYFDYKTGDYTTNIYPERNPGVVNELGDVGNDIQFYEDRLYVVVNGSNLIEVMDAQTAVHVGSVTVPNCRNIAFSGDYAYVSSYASLDESGMGYVAKIDLESLEIKGECKVGFQPEGLQVVGSKLYVANSGGYNTPDYDNTLSVIDLKDFTEAKKIEVAVNMQQIILDRYGYLWISSYGDYAEIPSKTYVLDTKDDSVVNVFEVPNLLMARAGDALYVISSVWDNETYTSKLDFTIVDIKEQEVLEGSFVDAETEFVSPYALAVNPITKEVFVSDALNYASPGKLYCFSKDAEEKWSAITGELPAALVFLAE